MDCLECKICHIQFDEEDHRPRNAQCGHELCTTCLRSLIVNGLYVCPKCRQESKIDIPDDLPVNFGLIDVIRAFKTRNISVFEETEPRLSGTTNYEICKVHHKLIEYRCVQCQMWICDDCRESHSTLIGCSIIRSFIAVNIMKEKLNQETKSVLSIFKTGSNYASSRIQEHSKKRKELLEMAKKPGEEEEKLSNMLKQGYSHKKKLIKSQNHLDTADSPNALMDIIDELTTRKQFLHSWTIKNLGDGSLNYFQKVSGEEKDFYAEMVIKDVKKHAKIFKHEDSFYFHSYKEETVGDGCISIPVEYLKNTIPYLAPLVFLELSLGGIPNGCVVFRLNKDIEGIEHIGDIFIGKQGPCLRGIKLSLENNHLGIRNLPFSEIPFHIKSEKQMAKQGDLIGSFHQNYFQDMFFNMKALPTQLSGFEIIGHVEEGLSVIQICYDNYKEGVSITDCGIVINQE